MRMSESKETPQEICVNLCVNLCVNRHVHDYAYWQHVCVDHYTSMTNKERRRAKGQVEAGGASRTL